MVGERYFNKQFIMNNIHNICLINHHFFLGGLVVTLLKKHFYKLKYLNYETYKLFFCVSVGCCKR